VLVQAVIPGKIVKR